MAPRGKKGPNKNTKVKGWDDDYDDDDEVGYDKDGDWEDEDDDWDDDGDWDDGEYYEEKF